MPKGPQCVDCGKHVDFLYDDGVCQACYNIRKEEEENK